MLADGSVGVLSWVRSTQDDSQEKQGVYRRDLVYAVNYATLQTQAEVAIAVVESSTVFVSTGLDAGAGDVTDANCPQVGPSMRLDQSATGVTVTLGA